MKKVISTFMAAIVTAALIAQPQVHAASAIKIYIDGKELVTDQAPLVSGSRTFVPLRGIFEALDASVLWDSSTKTITSYKDGTTVVLKLGAKTATINGQLVYLDAPAVSKNGRTLVPLRFVSESLGQSVQWVPSSQSVIIKTNDGAETPSPGSVDSAAYVSTRVSGQTGTGADVTVSFSRPANTANISGYRIFIVKEANASSFNYAKAQTVSSSNYTAVASNGADQSVTLTAQTRDVDGNTLTAGASYKTFVMSVGKTGGYALSSSSSTFTLAGLAVSAISGLTIRDSGDYGDGRDLTVSFSKASNDANISGYRVFIVKTSNASQFTLSSANATSSSYYTTVGKSGSTLSVTLNAGSRDTSGDLLRNGVSYTAYVLSVSSSSAYANKLSGPSASLTLNTVNTAPVVTRITDVADYGDGRDLQVTFTKSADESKVSYYRIFVVKAGNAGSFNLNAANAVSSGRYYDVARSGNSSITTILPSNMKDVQGASLTNGVSYRVFVMAMSNNPSVYPNLLSSASGALTLNYSTVSAVSNLKVSDTSDYGDGRDLLVSFNRAADESNVLGYRVFVVKSGDVNSFSLSRANSLSSSYYTSVSRTGGNLSLNLNSYTRSTDGAAITKGQSYRVFVLTVAASGDNVLSSASSAITLGDNLTLGAVSNLNVLDSGDKGDASDLNVSFAKAANESNVGSYRIMVVKDSDASRFTLTQANNVTSSYYKQVSKTGRDINLNLDAWMKTVDGETIKNGTAYRIFVLSVGASGYSGSNALSAASPVITLTGNLSISPVTGLTAALSSDNKAINVTFNKSETENMIEEYRILVVPSDRATFTLSDAQAVGGAGYLSVGKKGSTLTESISYDITGTQLQPGSSYKVYVLAVSNKSVNTPDVLSGPSSSVSLPAPEQAPSQDPGTQDPAQAPSQDPGTGTSTTP